MTTCKTGAEHIKSLKDGRTVYIDGKLVRRRHRASRRSAMRCDPPPSLYDFQAKPENIELDDVRAARLETARQPRLADAAQLRGDGGAAQGACRPGRRSPTVSWGAHRIISPRRWSASAWASRCSRSTDPRAPRRSAIISSTRAATIFSDLRHHQSAGRARQGLGRAEGGAGRPHRRRGLRRHHHPRRQDAGHELDHGQRGVRRQPAALKPGEEDLAFSCALPMNAKGLRVFRANHTRPPPCRCSTIRCRRVSTKTTR